MGRSAFFALAVCALWSTGAEAISGDAEPGGPGGMARVLVDGHFACTAVLVEPDRAWTAAHCVDHLLPDAPTASLVWDDEELPIRAFVLHPDHFRAVEADLAVLFLDHAAGATPMATRQGDLGTLWENWTVSVAGFGVTGPSQDDAGTARTFRTEIDEATEVSFLLAPSSASACDGDSGGPVWTEEGLIGIVTGGDPACLDGGEVLRIDSFATFLADPEGTAPGQGPGGGDDEVITGADPDGPSGSGCGSGVVAAILFLPGRGLRRRRP